MKIKKKAFIPPVIILLFIGLAVLASMMGKPPEKKQNVKPAPMVEVKEVQPENMTFIVDSQGTVRPKHSTQLLSEVSGQIIDIADNFNAGGFFSKGDMLLQIDPSDYKVAVQQAKAQLLQAQSALEEEKARARVAEEEWAMFKDGEAPALGLRKPQLASALSAVESAEANLAMAKRNLERTTIRAPFDAILRSKQADLGQFVGSGSQVAMLYGTGTAEVRLPLSDLDTTYLDMPSEGKQPMVHLQSMVNGISTDWQGRLVRTEGVLDENSRVVYGVVEVKDPYNLDGNTHNAPLRFGRFVDAKIEGQSVSNVMSVPTYAINEDSSVWIVDEERVLKHRTVQVIRTQSNDSIISGGLERGDKVVLTQLANPLPGTPVRLEGDPLPSQMESTAQKEQQEGDNQPSAESDSGEAGNEQTASNANR